MKVRKNSNLAIKILAIVLSVALLGGIVFSTLYSIFDNSRNNIARNSNNDAYSELYGNYDDDHDEYAYTDIRDLINDETAAKIVDMHYNIGDYEGNVETLIVQYFEMEELGDMFLIGVFDTLKDGENLLFSMIGEYKNGKLPKELENFDWVEVTGEIGISEIPHDDHFHYEPTMFISNIRKLSEEEVAEIAKK